MSMLTDSIVFYPSLTGVKPGCYRIFKRLNRSGKKMFLRGLTCCYRRFTGVWGVTGGDTGNEV